MNEEIRVCIRIILRTLLFILRNARFKKSALKEAENTDFIIQLNLRMMSRD